MVFGKDTERILDRALGLTELRRLAQDRDEALDDWAVAIRRYDNHVWLRDAT